jgi:hypothetical protein
MAAAAIACYGLVLIAWQHEDIPAIANAILGKAGVVPPKWPGDRFDVVWVFDLQPVGGYSFSQVPQMLLADDLPSVITRRIPSGRVRDAPSFEAKSSISADTTSNPGAWPGLPRASIRIRWADG